MPYLCIDIIDCSKSYYNLLQTECIDEVPEGYYCNDETKRTIAKCPDNCKTCSKDSAEVGLCLTCDVDNNAYIKEQEELLEKISELDWSKIIEEKATQGMKFDITI